MSARVAALFAALWCPAVLALQQSTVAADACVTETYVAQLQQADASLAAGQNSQALAHLRAAATLDGRAAAYLTPAIEDLAVAPLNLADARNRLDAVASTLALPRGSTCIVDSTQARKALHDVYSAGVFANLDQGTQPSVLQRILDWLRSLFTDAAHALGPVAGGVIGAIVLPSVAALVCWRARRVAASRAAAVNEEPAAESNDPQQEWTLALAAASRGDYRQATRRAFRAALLDVAWRGRMHIDASWTTRELLAAAAGDADLVALLAPAAALFDRVWYSGARATEADWTLMRSRCEAIRRVASKRRAEAVG